MTAQVNWPENSFILSSVRQREVWNAKHNNCQGGARVRYKDVDRNAPRAPEICPKQERLLTFCFRRDILELLDIPTLHALVC